MIDCNGCEAKFIAHFLSDDGSINSPIFAGMNPRAGTTEVGIACPPHHDDTVAKKEWRHRYVLSMSPGASKLKDGNCPDAPDGGQCPQDDGCSGTLDVTFYMIRINEYRTYELNDLGIKFNFSAWTYHSELVAGPATVTATAPGECMTDGHPVTESVTLVNMPFHVTIRVSCEPCWPDD